MVAWHQLDHMQIICDLLQTDNHASTSSLNVFTVRMLFLTPSQQCQSVTTITTTTVLQPFVQDYPGEPVPEETLTQSPTHHPDHHPILINFFHLPWSIASSLFKLCAWQSFCTTYVHVLFGLPLGLEPSTSYSTHFFTQSLSCFCNTCPYHRNLFYCSISIISSIASLSLSSLPGTPFLWSPYGIWQTIIFSSCRLFFFFFFLLFFLA